MYSADGSSMRIFEKKNMHPSEIQCYRLTNVGSYVTITHKTINSRQKDLAITGPQKTQSISVFFQTKICKGMCG